jgi:hypothetical protein
VTPSEIRLLAVAIADELDRRRHSQGGIGSPGQGDQDCSRESMDHTNTATDGESTSLSAIEEQGRRDIALLIHGSRRTPISTARETKPKGTRSGKR